MRFFGCRRLFHRLFYCLLHVAVGERAAHVFDRKLMPLWSVHLRFQNPNLPAEAAAALALPLALALALPLALALAVAVVVAVTSTMAEEVVQEVEL